MKKNFDKFLETISTPFFEMNYFNDDEKIINNVEKYKKELTDLDGLIDVENIEKNFINLLKLILKLKVY